MKNIKLILLSICLTVLANAPVQSEPAHGIAMHGKPKLPPNFTHFEYANPVAPKGGELRLAVTGSFDSTNPLIIKGNAVAGVRSYVLESLMARNLAEPFALYGLIAETVDVNEERTRMEIRLRKQARFADGKPVTSKDVLFSLETLKEKGRPNHRTYYSKVLKATAPDDHTIIYELETGDRELVLILGLMPVLPEHVYARKDFAATTLEPMIGSGPYRMKSIKPGEQIVYERDPNYWGKDLAVSKGFWNFDTVRYDYFRDQQSGFEAFKKGLIDVRTEGDPGRWATGYDIAAEDGSMVIKQVIKTGLPKPASGLVFNTRKEIFSDVRVREALTYVFDFEWANENLYHGSFARTQGYFDGSSLSSIGVKADERERALLKEIAASVPSPILNGTHKVPVSDGSGRDRKNLRTALQLFSKAGWRAKNGVLRNNITGKPFEFEMLIQNSDQERIALHFQRSLRQIGIAMSIRQIDSAQFQRRRQSYEFDMMPFTWFSSLSPGNEQTFRWGSSGRTQEGTYNLAGVNDPAIDKAIEAMLAARDSTSFTTAVRVLERLLIAGFYIMPLYHAEGQWLARWDRIRLPETFSLYGFSAPAAWRAQ